MNGCEDCSWPLTVHDRDLRFQWPDAMADWSDLEREFKAELNGSFLHVEDLGFFLRAIAPAELVGGHLLAFGVWLAVEKSTVLAAADVWESEDYGGWSCEGVLANRLPMWDESVELGLVKAEPRDLNEVPYVVGSPVRELDALLAERWDHEPALSLVATSMPGSTATLICKHIHDRSRDVLFAYREQDMLALMCGESDHEDSDDDFHVVGIGQLISEDASIEELRMLPEGDTVQRQAIGQQWQPVAE